MSVTLWFIENQHTVEIASKKDCDIIAHKSKQNMIPEKKQPNKMKPRVEWKTIDMINSEIMKFSNFKQVTVPRNIEKWHQFYNIHEPLKFFINYK